MAEQFRAIREMGIENADLTDNHDGGILGAEFGFTASVSLDSHPHKIRKMAEDAGVLCLPKTASILLDNP
jgi:hypothetical protein